MTGPLAPQVQVTGTRRGAPGDLAGWRVLVLLTDGQGGVMTAALELGRAEHVAADLLQMVAVCREEHAALAQREAEKRVSDRPTASLHEGNTVRPTASLHEGRR